MQFSSKRSVGFIALAYALSMIAQNAIFAISGAPGYSDELGKVFAYHAENQSALAFSSGLEAVNMVLLLLFLSALHSLIHTRGGKGAEWSQLSTISGAVVSVLFALTIATHIAVTLAAASLSEPDTAFEIMWQLHAATFALALPALGLTFISVSLAMYKNGITKPWQQFSGVIAGALPIVAGVGNLAIAGGSPLIFLGVFSLFIWLIWLFVIGLRLIRN